MFGGVMVRGWVGAVEVRVVSAINSIAQVHGLAGLYGVVMVRGWVVDVP